MEKSRKKLSLTLKIIIILAVFAVVFFVLALSAAIVSVNRTKDAIADIGTVEYTAESKAKIDLALSYYAELDVNIGLQNRITNVDDLISARREYVRLAIKTMYLAEKSGEDEEVVTALMTEARNAFNEYCSDGECAEISNYQDLVDAEAKYGAQTPSVSESGTVGNEPVEDEEIELC